MSAQPRAAIERGMPADAGEAGAWRTAVRVRASGRHSHRQRIPRRVARWGWLVVLALHLLLILALRYGERARPRVSPDSVVEVELIAAPAPVPPLPLPQSPPTSRPHRVAAPPTAAPQIPPLRLPEAPAIGMPEPPALDALPQRVFNDDGSAAVPDDLVEQIDHANAPTGFIPLRIAPSPLLHPRRPLKVRPNHFAQYWNGTDGQSLGAAFWRNVTVTREFTAPWGGRYACAWVLIVVACADVPEKAWSPPQRWKPATEFDER